jgi:hypothetical protein
MNGIERTASLLASAAHNWVVTLGAAQECTAGGVRFADQAL